MQKMISKKYFSDWWIMQFLEKLWKTEVRRKWFNSRPNYHTTKSFTENLLAIEMKRWQIIKNKPVYLGLSILEMSKTVMYEFWYDYVKPKYREETKLCYMDTGSFTVHIKTENIYVDSAKDVDKRFDSLNYESDGQLSN